MTHLSCRISNSQPAHGRYPPGGFSTRPTSNLELDGNLRVDRGGSGPTRHQLVASKRKPTGIARLLQVGLGLGGEDSRAAAGARLSPPRIGLKPARWATSRLLPWTPNNYQFPVRSRPKPARSHPTAGAWQAQSSASLPQRRRTASACCAIKGRAATATCDGGGSMREISGPSEWVTRERHLGEQPGVDGQQFKRPPSSGPLARPQPEGIEKLPWVSGMMPGIGRDLAPSSS